MARADSGRRSGFRQESGRDYGPSVSQVDGRMVSWGGAGSVFVETRDDPTVIDRVRPVRGARRRNALLDLHARKIISRRQYNAAENFLDDCSLAQGGRVGDPVYAPPSYDPAAAGVSEVQFLAMERIRRVQMLLGLDDQSAFWWVVFGNGALGDYERLHRMRNGTASEQLSRSLNELDEFYYARTIRRS